MYYNGYIIICIFIGAFLGFFIFLVAMQAELTQTPFDMPIAESELVSGYMTEYSGMRFLLFFIAEFASAGAFSAVAATLWKPPVGEVRTWSTRGWVAPVSG